MFDEVILLIRGLPLYLTSRVYPCFICYVETAAEPGMLTSVPSMSNAELLAGRLPESPATVW